MKKRYIIGVDGGNTKTDYFLFDTDANFIDHYRGGTCSHEALPDSYDGSFRVMNEVFQELFNRNNITVDDVETAVFGLAGVDIPIQKQNLEDVVRKIGFKNFIVVNDSFLGIKAGTTYGYGVCSVNGTGTSSGGIDPKGNTLQVGGIGQITGDEAGGYHLSRQVVRAAFDYAYRFGKPTSLYKIVMDFLGITDKYYLMEAISTQYLTRKKNYTDLTIALFEEANKGDEVAIEILKSTAEQLARSAGGCVVNLDFDSEVEVVLVGSVWVKGSCPILIQEFNRLINLYTNKKCVIKVLEVPPATGAIIWALELATGKFPSLESRQVIINTVANELNKN
ncbi:MAG: N-acetylglucosamine kinase [Acholeplasmataceae bacterium]|nr:N-acetylglucosamine kinase [Acholeplasmataceae bacterium]HPT89448.1 BadF/BadG/BcrA/BcrD ATPase family protein [Bacilli bacterium]HQA19466.1 BadF/BadG/BcrA/BcrD ATPase family protein [Bacilli bacterium]HQD91980.1 BadF/BadG/BcrA/BcrD ATPase family protein [Bacilli bacterium]